MITADLGGHVNLWKRQDNQLSYTFQDVLQDPAIGKADDIGIHSISFSPDDNFIATGSNYGTVKLWSKDGERYQVLKDKDLAAHKALVKSISFSSDGQILATASYDKTVKLWKKQNNKYMYYDTLKDPKLEEREDRVWSHEDQVWSVSFSPDDSFIATSSQDKTIKIWKRQNGQYKYFKTLYGHNDIVTSISFSPDGTLVSTSLDKRVILWKSYQKTLDELLVDACNWARNYLDNNSKVSEKDKELCDGIDTLNTQK